MDFRETERVETGDVAKRQVLETDTAPGPDFGPLALSWGPEITPSGAVRFRLWAPRTSTRCSRCF